MVTDSVGLDVGVEQFLALALRKKVLTMALAS